MNKEELEKLKQLDEFGRPLYLKPPYAEPRPKQIEDNKKPDYYIDQPTNLYLF